MLPVLSGRPVRVEVRRDLGPYHAATSIPKRYILLEAGVFSHPREFERILVHELFHFVWVRLSNAVRRDWERGLAREFATRVQGELGWSAEWRKDRLGKSDVHLRTPLWRRYACESFCDTAAWMYGELGQHPEFTLPSKARRERRTWFRSSFPGDVPVRF